MTVSPTHLLLLLIGATVVLALSRSWRIALLAFLAHYVALGGLVLELGPVARSGLRILMGSLICLVLFLTVRQTRHKGKAKWDRRIGRRQVSEFALRLAGIALAGIGAFGTPIPGWFPSLPVELVLASAWLIALGVVVLLISREALWVGLGLLMAEGGFETLYTALDPRLVSAGLLAGGGLLLALVIAVVIAYAEHSAEATTRPGD